MHAAAAAVASAAAMHVPTAVRRLRAASAVSAAAHVTAAPPLPVLTGERRCHGCQLHTHAMQPEAAAYASYACASVIRVASGAEPHPCFLANGQTSGLDPGPCALRQARASLTQWQL